MDRTIELKKDFLENTLEAYERFQYNLLTHDGIYIYPEYSRDLSMIMNYVDLTLYDYFPENSEEQVA